MFFHSGWELVNETSGSRSLTVNTTVRERSNKCPAYAKKTARIHIQAVSLGIINKRCFSKDKVAGFHIHTLLLK